MIKKSILQIIHSINDSPELWLPYSSGTVHKKWDSLKNDCIKVENYGNSRMLSIINVLIHDERLQLNNKERSYLEKAVIKWYKECDLTTLMS